MLVHLDRKELLEAYSWAWIEVDPSQVREVSAASLPSDWAREPATSASRDFGTDWLKMGASVALRVPSVIVHAEHNILLNPAHADFIGLARGEFEPFRFDQRLS